LANDDRVVGRQVEQDAGVYGGVGGVADHAIAYVKQPDPVPAVAPTVPR
jgi:hypothetical protein